MCKNIIHIITTFASSLLVIMLCIMLSTNAASTTNNYNIPPTEQTKYVTEPIEMQTTIILQTEPVVINQTTTKPEFLTFNPDITFESDYKTIDGIIPYAIFTPSCANADTTSALIIWLHGSHDIDANSPDFMSRYFPGLMSNWPSEGFNAYVVCPQLIDDYKQSHWCTPQLEIELRILISHIMSDRNIDPNRIYLTGASLGGQGTIYHSVRMGDVFTKSAALSGYGSRTVYANLTIPMLGIVGTRQCGEDGNSIDFMRSNIKPVIAKANFIELNASHSDLPEIAFKMDLNNNNRSDIIEWLFSEETEFQIPEEK